MSDFRRPLDKHLENHELNALVPSLSEAGAELCALAPDAIGDAERHLLVCPECCTKVSKYRRLINLPAGLAEETARSQGTDCINANEVDWRQVADGLLPASTAVPLILHAALCDDCGPLLRRAAATRDDLIPWEQESSVQYEARPGHDPKPSSRWLLPRLLIPWTLVAATLLLIAGLLSTMPSLLSGPRFAELAVNAHRQHAEGKLALEVRSDSQKTLNEWFKTKLQFALALPAVPAAPGEERPFRLEGARLVQVKGRNAAYIAYQMQKGAASLLITSDSVAIASGGVAVDFKKVTFHYATIDGYKVVTWTAHGITYALVSDEGNSTQRSCMVCHSALRDRDLSRTPTPLRDEDDSIRPVLQ